MLNDETAMLRQSSALTTGNGLKADGWYRTPLQVFVLAYATFGCYAIYWFLRNRRLAENYLGVRPTSYWYGLLALVPIANLFLYWDCCSKIGDRVRASEVHPPIPFGLLWTMWIGLSALPFLPSPYWLISLVAAVPVAVMHASLARAERKDDPGYFWPSFNAWEWTAVLLGSFTIVLDMLYLLATMSGYDLTFTIVMGVAVLGSLVAFWRDTKRFKAMR